jgi:hypothetical protein
MYDPTAGRWTSQDPEGFLAGDPDLYRYVGNDPTNEIDPSGMIEVHPSGPPGTVVGAVTNIDAKLKGRAIDNFGGVKADITGSVADYRTAGGKVLKYIKFTVSTRGKTPADIAAMSQAHWLQKVKFDRFNAKGEKDNGGIYSFDVKGTGPKAAYVCGALSVLPAGRILSGLNTLAGQVGYYDVTYKLTGKYGEEYLDTAYLNTPYVDESSIHERSPTSLSTYDSPQGGLSAVFPKIVVTGTTTLVLGGKSLYEVVWTQTRVFAGVGKDPTVSYDISKSGQTPAGAGPATYTVGYFDEKTTDPVEISNPIQGAR